MKKHVFLFLILFCTPLVIFAGGQAESEPAAVTAVEGVIEYFDGEVMINDQPADFGMKVPFGTVVRTGPDAYCEIVFSGKNIFRISESTIVEINLEIGSPEIIIDQGAVASLFMKLDILTSDEPFRVKTQTTVAGVRGTAFFIKVIDPDTTYVCLCNGELELAEADGSNPADYSSGHHEAVYFRKVDGKIEVSDAPMLYHTDAGMNSLADHIDEKINWYY